jgi:hypothetical protein
LVRHLGSQLVVLVAQASRRKKEKEVARINAQAHQEQEESSGFEHELESDEEGGANGEGLKEMDNEDGTIRYR